MTVALARASRVRRRWRVDDSDEIAAAAAVAGDVDVPLQLPPGGRGDDARVFDQDRWGGGGGFGGGAGGLGGGGGGGGGLREALPGGVLRRRVLLGSVLLGGVGAGDVGHVQPALRTAQVVAAQQEPAAPAPPGGRGGRPVHRAHDAPRRQQPGQQ